MSQTVQILISAAGIMLLSLAGAAFIQRQFRTWMFRNLQYLVSFSAGVFLVTALLMAQETLELLSDPYAIGSIVFGFLLFFFGQKLIPESHHHHSESCEGPDCPVPDRKRGALRMLFGDGIHNIGDGILLVPAFLAGPNVGIAAIASIFIHELLQEVSEFFVLLRAGYTPKQALLRNFSVASTILIGVILGLLLTSLTALQGILLGVAAGGFLFIVFFDLIPYKELKPYGPKSHFLQHALAFMVGIALLVTINVFSDGHQHEPHEEHPTPESVGI